MARTSSIWQRKRDGWYMTTLNGKQVKLALDKKEAKKAFHELMARTADAPPETSRLSFKKLADRFLTHCERTMAWNTYDTRKWVLQAFCDHVKKKAVSDLRVEHVSAWEEKNPHWSQSTVASYRAIIAACLNWAEEQQIIPGNPLKKLKIPAYTRRERILTQDERERIKAAVSPQLRDFLTALELTGARPYSEVGSLTADMIDWETGTIPLDKHKNRKKGKSRTIYLSPPLEELLRRKCADHPTGLLFRTKFGKKWSATALWERLKKVIAELKIPHLTCYAVRHSFTTDALERGLSAEVVAELVGNSAATVAKHYAHLDQKKAAMRAAAARAVG